MTPGFLLFLVSKLTKSKCDSGFSCEFSKSTNASRFPSVLGSKLTKSKCDSGFSCEFSKSTYASRFSSVLGRKLTKSKCDSGFSLGVVNEQGGMSAVARGLGARHGIAA